MGGFTILLPMYDNSIPSLKWTINLIGSISVLINGMVLERYMVLMEGGWCR